MVRSLTVVLLLALAVPAGAATAPSPEPLTISPAPGTPDASPKTGISVLGTPRSTITSVTLTGAQSGAHPGRLLPFSANRGAVFVPSAPLAEGEAVRAVIRVRGRAPVTRTFTVARFAADPPVLNLPATQPAKLRHYVSEPQLTPPRITVLKRTRRFRDGLFLTPLPSPIVHPGSVQTVTITPVGPGGPLIADDDGQPIWFRQVQRPSVAANLQLQRFGGRDVLTWWEGPVTAAAYGLGRAIIADRSYRFIHHVHAGNGYPMDLHEFALTPEGDALFTIYSRVKIHVPGTPAGELTSVLDAMLQQVDVRTGRVTWEWHALGHIPLSDSYATPKNSAFYDAYHFNSAQSVSTARVLLSARDTSALYLVDRPSGRVLWTLGGKSSDFRLGKGARFWFQHDARLIGSDRVSLFDDEAGPPQKAPASRGLILTLDQRRRTATVAREYRRAKDTSAQSEGSLQLLPGGNVFAGFGATPYFSEFTADGRHVVFDAKLPDDDGSYRVQRHPWSATPRTKPVAAALTVAGGQVDVYASWNGATAVRRWRVIGDGKVLTPFVPRTGFETAIRVTSAARKFFVQAVDARGHFLAASPAVAPR